MINISPWPSYIIWAFLIYVTIFMITLMIMQIYYIFGTCSHETVFLLLYFLRSLSTCILGKDTCKNRLRSLNLEMNVTLAGGSVQLFYLF